MIGAIIGDIVGSRFEWNNHRSKNFEFFHPDCRFTDDTVMTIAVAAAIMNANGDLYRLPDEATKSMQELGKCYSNCGFGGKFRKWIYYDNPHPYNSYGNGAAMRVSACGYAARSLDEAKTLALAVTGVTHNHIEGFKGAEAVAVAAYLARTGTSMADIREYVTTNYYPLDFTLDDIRPTYQFDSSCQGSVPQALEAFFESTSFEDAIRNAISIGGDSDTIAAITGSIAEAYYGVPANLRKSASMLLDHHLFEILQKFECKTAAIT